MIDVFDNTNNNEVEIDTSEFTPIISEEDEKLIKEFYSQHKLLTQNNYLTGSSQFNEKDAWIQTYSGKRFTPTNPNPQAIVIQDIAHALSMLCRFNGHVKCFYSVAQHSVLVSYICDFKDALWGLLHDATEAVLTDLPSPLKRSGQFESYIKFEKKMQEAICVRFGLPFEEPESVKMADKMLLSTEARDLLNGLRSDWIPPVEPLPFIINAWTPEYAKEMFIKRFYELTKNPEGYKEYSKIYHEVK